MRNIPKPKYNRFKDAPWFSEQRDVYCLVGGAGGISSWLTLFLSRAGFNPMVYDFDILEEHNLGGQLYSKSQIGKPKVTALQEVVKQFSDEHIQVFQQKYQEDSLAHNITFAGFDNMAARKVMYELWKDYSLNIFEGDKGQSIFIDGRLLAEQMQVICIRATDEEAMKKYEEEYLFSDSEVEDAMCTFKQTSHAAAMIAGMMTGFFTNHISNLNEGNQARAVPFYTEYFIPLNMLTQL